MNRQLLSSEEKAKMVSYGKPNGQNTAKKPAPVVLTKKKSGGCGCGK